MSQQNVCKYQNLGYCKYKDKCMYIHVKEKFESKCKNDTCRKRQRHNCMNGAYCKYKLKCEFKHDDISDTRVLTEKEELKNSVKELTLKTI